MTSGISYAYLIASENTWSSHEMCWFFGTLVQATFVQNQILRRVFLWDCNKRKWVLRGSPDALSRYYGSGMLVLTVRSKVISSERIARIGESWVFLSFCKMLLSIVDHEATPDGRPPSHFHSSPLWSCAFCKHRGWVIRCKVTLNTLRV